MSRTVMSNGGRAIVINVRAIVSNVDGAQYLCSAIMINVGGDIMMNVGGYLE